MKGTVTTRVNLLIIFSYLLLLMGIALFSKIQLTKMSDVNQSRIYKEKLETIYKTVQRKYDRLQLTGMVEAYEEDFQFQVLADIKHQYYSEGSITVYPFILDSNGVFLLHPVYPYGDSSLIDSSYIQHFISEKVGEHYYTSKEGQKKWAPLKRFKEWGWSIGYTVPLSEKYTFVNQYLYMLIPILALFCAVVVMVITVLVKKVLHPVTALTEASIEIASGNLEYEVPPIGVGEIATLTQNFKEMQYAIKSKIEEIAKSEENLRITLHSIGDGVIATNAEGCIVQMNPIASTLTGWESSDALGKHLNEVFTIETSDEIPIIDTVEKTIKAGVATDLPEYTLLKSRNEKVFIISDSSAPIRNALDDIVGVVVVFHDVTEEYKLKGQLQQSQKMDAIGQLAGGVAHDFNNMLGGIVGATELLKRRVKDEECLSFLDIIIQASRSAASLTGKLLDFSRKGKIESTPISVHKSIEEAVSLLERSIDKKIQIELQFESEGDTIVGDLSQMQNVFLNLGINASHAMNEKGGVLRYRSSLFYADKIYCESIPFDLQEGEFIKIEVEDNGCGIPVEHLQKVFEPFFTTKEEGSGTGLGLAAVYGTVQQHRGAITVYSEEGKGTTFQLLLPLVSSAIVHKPSFDEFIKGEGTILVIDDEEILRILAKSMLKELGYDCLVAKNGREGLETYKEYKDTVDLVILDVIMPQMDGRECFHQLREFDPDVKVILSSGFTKDADIDTLKREGLCAFVHKPFTMLELSSAISEALHNK